MRNLESAGLGCFACQNLSLASSDIKTTEFIERRFCLGVGRVVTGTSKTVWGDTEIVTWSVGEVSLKSVHSLIVVCYNVIVYSMFAELTR